MIIRRANEGDIPAIQNILRQVNDVHAALRPDLFHAGGTKHNGEELRAILAEEARPVFVAETEGQVVGYAFCVEKRERTPTLYLDDLCVDAAWRRHGIASAIFDCVTAYAKQNGFYSVTLNVWAGNESAQAFYLSRGMTVQKTTMEKIL